MTKNEQQDISDLKSDVRNMSKTLDRVAEAMEEIAQIQVENREISKKVEDHEARLRELEKMKHSTNGMVSLFKFIGATGLGVIVLAVLQYFNLKK